MLQQQQQQQQTSQPQVVTQQQPAQSQQLILQQQLLQPQQQVQVQQPNQPPAQQSVPQPQVQQPQTSQPLQPVGQQPQQVSVAAAPVKGQMLSRINGARQPVQQMEMNVVSVGFLARCTRYGKYSLIFKCVRIILWQTTKVLKLFICRCIELAFRNRFGLIPLDLFKFHFQRLFSQKFYKSSASGRSITSATRASALWCQTSDKRKKFSSKNEGVCSFNTSQENYRTPHISFIIKINIRNFYGSECNSVEEKIKTKLRCLAT